MGSQDQGIYSFYFGIGFVFPGALLFVAGFLEPEMRSDDALGMFFMGGLLTFCGLLIWWVMRNMYRRGKRRAVYLRTQEDEGMMMGMGMAHMHNMAAMNGTDDRIDADSVDTDVDTGDFDSGGDFDIGD